MTNNLRAAQAHQLKVERTGTGLSDKARKVCSCGWQGPWRYEADNYCYTKLAGDEYSHLDNVRQMWHTS